MTDAVPAGHWSLDFDDFSRPHTCPMYGGARTYALHLAKKGRWPPPAPIFYVPLRVPGPEPLFRRWLRHGWLELDAGFGFFAVIGGRPGIGKSTTLVAIGRSLYGPFDVNQHIIYEGHELIVALEDPTPYVPVFADEALVKIFWSVKWQEEGFQGGLEAVIKHARHNKHPVFVVAQQESALTWMIRDSFFGWWLSLTSRSPITQSKAGTLFHGVETYHRDRVTRGYKMGRQMIYYRAGNLTTPSVAVQLSDKYEGLRERGVSDRKEHIEARERIR